MLYVREESEREQCQLLCSLLVFSHFPHYPQSNWALLVLLPRWMGLCTFWDPIGLSNKLCCEAGVSPAGSSTFTGDFNHRFEALFPWAGTLGCMIRLAPQLFLPVYLHTNVGPPSPRSTALPGLPAAALPTLVLQPLPCHESSLSGCLSPPLLPIWMNVSSLTPWLSDFHTVRFFCQFWLFLVFKFAVVFLLFVRGGTVCLPTPPSWLDEPVCQYFVEDFSIYVLQQYWVEFSFFVMFLSGFGISMMLAS